MKAFPFVFVVEETVDVVVNRIIVHHLSDRDIKEESWIIRALEVFGKNLHEHCLSDPDAPLKEDVLVQFISTLGEDLFSQLTIIEIINEEPDYITVIIINLKRTTLRGENDVVGHIFQHRHMRAEYGGVREIGHREARPLPFILGFPDYRSDHDERIGLFLFPLLQQPQYRLIPVDIAGWPYSELPETFHKTLWISHGRLNIYTAETAIELIVIVGRRLGLRFIFLLFLEPVAEMTAGILH